MHQAVFMFDRNEKQRENYERERTRERITVRLRSSGARSGRWILPRDDLQRW